MIKAYFVFNVILILFFCKNVFSLDHRYKLEILKSNLSSPWSLTFINNNQIVISEKTGKIKLLDIQNNKITEIEHNLNVIRDKNSQGGLLDIYYYNDQLFISYAEKIDNKLFSPSTTSIAKAKFNLNYLDFKNIFRANPPFRSPYHYGSRLVIHNDYLYASVGERGKGMIAQETNKHPGSIIRINLDGTIPIDNPAFLDKPNWLPEIFLIGVRNPQGMAVSPNDEKIYFSQHGPRGGDNIGIIIKGGNYGWKDIAWGGTEYFGAKIGTSAFKKKYNKPVISWVPSIGVSQINFYKGQTFSEWNGDILVSSTKEGLLIRLMVEENKIVDEEIILDQSIGRIRDFEIDIKGDIYLVTDASNSHLWRLYR